MLLPEHDSRNPRVTVHSNEFEPAWPKGERGVVAPLLEALRIRWSSDAHFLCYVADGYRVKKRNPASGQPELQGTCVALDIDQPGHAPWQSQEQAAATMAATLKHIREHEEALLPLACYSTRAGYRLVWALERLASGCEVERTRKALVERLGALGVPLEADEQTKDWSRFFRLPLVIRDGAPSWASWEPLQAVHASAVPLAVVDAPVPAEPFLDLRVLPPFRGIPEEDPSVPEELRWRTTSLTQIPEGVEGALDPTATFPLAWSRDELSGALEITPRAQRVVSVFANTPGLDRKKRASAILSPEGKIPETILPRTGQRDNFVLEVCGDLCEAACKVLGGSPELVHGIVLPLLIRMDHLRPNDGPSWVDVAAEKIERRWAEKRTARHAEVIASEALPRNLAEITMGDVQGRPDRIEALAAAKGVCSKTIEVWAKIAEQVSRLSDTLDKFLEWFVWNAAAASLRDMVFFDPGHGNYMPVSLAHLKDMVHKVGWLSPLKNNLLIQVENGDGVPEIVPIKQASQYPIKFIDAGWPGVDDIRLVRARTFDCRETDSCSLYNPPVVWHQIDKSLRPKRDPFFAALLRHLFGEDWEAYGRPYMRAVCEPDKAKPGLVLCGEPGIGKTTLARVLARLYGNSTPAELVIDGFDHNNGFGKWTAVTLNRGPVFLLDDKKPNRVFVQFALDNLGGSVRSVLYENKRLTTSNVQLAPILIATTNNLELFSVAVSSRCRSAPERDAVSDRFIALYPETENPGEWRLRWKETFDRYQTEEEVYKAFAEHILFEGLSAEADDCQPPKDSRCGGGNEEARSFAQRSVLDGSAESTAYLAAGYLASQQAQAGIVGTRVDLDWPLINGRTPAARVRVPRGVFLHENRSDWIVGKWWIVQPNNLTFGSGRDEASWARKLYEAGASYVHFPRKGSSLRFHPEQGNGARWGIRGVLIDLFPFAHQVGIENLGKVGEHLITLGYTPEDE